MRFKLVLVVAQREIWMITPTRIVSVTVRVVVFVMAHIVNRNMIFLRSIQTSEHPYNRHKQPMMRQSQPCQVHTLATSNVLVTTLTGSADVTSGLAVMFFIIW